MTRRAAREEHTEQILQAIFGGAYEPAAEPEPVHRIDLRSDRGAIAVTCTCLMGHRGGASRGVRYRQIIESRRRFPAAEALSTWRAWHEKKGITV